MTTRQHDTSARQARLNAVQQEQRKRRLTRRALVLAATIAVLGLMAFGLWQARPTTTEGATTKIAPAFTLPTTAGTNVSLSDYRGNPVILYFNEGAGCGSCTQQMAAIEKDADFAKSGIVVLPIVMNTAAQIQPDMDRFESRRLTFSTTAPSPRRMTPSTRACTRACPDTASSSSTRTETSAGRATTLHVGQARHSPERGHIPTVTLTEWSASRRQDAPRSGPAAWAGLHAT